MVLINCINGICFVCGDYAQTDKKGYILMRQIGKVVALAAFLGLFLGISFFGPSKDMPFSQVVITYAFQYYQFGYTDIVYITTRMLPYLLFLFCLEHIYTNISVRQEYMCFQDVRTA